MDKEETKPSLYRALKGAHDERTAFIFIDVVAGSAGLWIPIIVGILHSGATVGLELQRLFDSAGAYIFAIAFLAASSSFLYLERRKNVVNEIRESYDRYAGWYAIAGIAIGMLLVGLQLSSTIVPADDKSGEVTPIRQVATLETKVPQLAQPSVQREQQHSYLQSPKKSNNSVALPMVQLAYLCTAIWLGVRLFCLRNISKIPGELEHIKLMEAAHRKKLIDEAQESNHF